jgi:hypothetical protein
VTRNRSTIPGPQIADNAKPDKERPEHAQHDDHTGCKTGQGVGVWSTRDNHFVQQRGEQQQVTNRRKQANQNPDRLAEGTHHIILKE